MAGINRIPFWGKESNEKRTRSPLNFAITNGDKCLLVTIENKHLTSFMDGAETDNDLRTLINEDLAVNGFQFQGDDMGGTTSFLVPARNIIPAVLEQLIYFRDKIWCDWLSHIQLHEKSTLEAVANWAEIDGRKNYVCNNDYLAEIAEA